MNAIQTAAQPMTQPVQATPGNAAHVLRRFEAARDGLPGDCAGRRAAADWLGRNGFPRRTAEAFRYTELRPLWEGNFATGNADPGEAAALFHRVMDRAGLDIGGETALPRLVFVDGLLSAALSHVPADVAGLLGLAAFTGVPLQSLSHPIVALNTAMARDGLVLHLGQGVDAGRLLLVTLSLGQVESHLRHRIVLEAGASLSLLEIAAGEGVYLNDGMIEAEVAAGGHLRHARLQQDDARALSFSMVQAEVAERGGYDGFNLALGASLARHEVHAKLTGAHAIVHVNGAQLLADAQVADLTSVISHDAPHCNSRQTVKNVLTGRSRGVFQGKIFVAQVAQKTDGYQMNQALLLSPDAEIDAKPELEIYADDVKCSHGATAGALDEEQLFYMRSRGVPAAEARAILVRAFLDDALTLVEDPLSHDVLDRAVAAWWVGRPA